MSCFIEEVTRTLRTGIRQGAELYCILQALGSDVALVAKAWYEKMRARGSSLRQRGKTCEAVARMTLGALSLAFNGWSSTSKARRAMKAQRLQSVQQTVTMGLAANAAAVFAAWSKGRSLLMPLKSIRSGDAEAEATAGAAHVLASVGLELSHCLMYVLHHVNM